jgi:hypothetical protein
MREVLISIIELKRSAPNVKHHILFRKCLTLNKVNSQQLVFDANLMDRYLCCIRFRLASAKFDVRLSENPGLYFVSNRFSTFQQTPSDRI